MWGEDLTDGAEAAAGRRMDAHFDDDPFIPSMSADLPSVDIASSMEPKLVGGMGLPPPLSGTSLAPLPDGMGAVLLPGRLLASSGDEGLRILGLAWLFHSQCHTLVVVVVSACLDGS